MKPYGCISTGHEVGLIEVVLNAETVSNIQLQYGGSSAAFLDQPIDEWIRKHNPNGNLLVLNSFIHKLLFFLLLTCSHLILFFNHI